MVANSAAFLCAALEKKEFTWKELTRATVTFQFKATVPDPQFLYRVRETRLSAPSRCIPFSSMPLP